MMLRGLFALTVAASSAAAQSWRQTAAGAGTTARVLLIGTRPEDEDNALIAWLSLGRHIETAYLSLTRGESSPNVAGNERGSALAVVRTAELLAERDRDHAHQYFTRAYDFGPTMLDSVVDASWPRDSLVHDVVSIVRAFRPHVIISLVSESGERDATRRTAARLAREAFTLAGDSVRLPPAMTQLLPPWSVARLVTRLDSIPADQAGVIRVDVGEFDRATGRSYAELGADIRRLQRTQPGVRSPPVGHVWRALRLDDTRADIRDSVPTLFADADTSLTRFAAIGAPPLRASFDSLVRDLASIRSQAATAGADSIAASLARVAARVVEIRADIGCRDIDRVAACAGTLADFALSLGAIYERATRTLVGAANIVVDGTVDRAMVAERDGVPISISIFNGGGSPFIVRRLAASSGSASISLLAMPQSSTIVQPDSVVSWSATVGVNVAEYHWWQFHGLIQGTWFHQVVPPTPRRFIPQLISGEDRIPASGVDATITIAGVDVRLVKTPLDYRGPGTVRGDIRYRLTGVPPVSVLLERSAEYERAGLPIDRLFRVQVSSAHTKLDTITIELTPPAGLRVDSSMRVVTLPALGSSTVFFRLRGMLRPGQDSIDVSARLSVPMIGPLPNGVVPSQGHKYQIGTINRDYPHISSQQFQRGSTDRVEIVDLRAPTNLRVAYIKGAEDVQPQLGQLQINVQAIEPSLLRAIDLSFFSTVLIGSGALDNDALAPAIPALRSFLRKGGTVVVLPGGREIATSGLLPYPITLDSSESRFSDPSGALRIVNAESRLLHWPNAITAADFDHWSVDRARGVPASFDARYRTTLSISDVGHASTTGALLSAPVGKGLVIYSALSLDTQLAAVTPGAARLFVNLLSAGLEGGAPRK
jgi:hypothetical protein